MKHFRLLVSTIVVLCVASSSLACLWDSDTLRQEAKGLPGVVETLVGAFDRLPPEYYERRLEIATERLGVDPDKLDSYDDAAVACDRLGRSGDALGFLDQKRAALDRLPENEEHEYRYYANRGTVLVHRWIRGGAKRDDLGGLQAGRDDIARALEINPDAHFGRERVQLAVMDWLLAPVDEVDLGRSGLPFVLSQSREWNSDKGKTESYLIEVADGLRGLMVLGAAWDSIDITISIGIIASRRQDSSIARIALLRARELNNSGRLSLRADAIVNRGESNYDIASSLGYISFYSLTDERAIDEFFGEARIVADAQRASRNEFVLAKLADGIHPDTHEDFWVGAPEFDLPSIPNGILGLAGMRLMVITPAAILIAIGLLISAFIIHLMRNQKRRGTQVGS